MSKRILAWTDEAWDSYVYWQRQDKKTLKRINKLIKEAKNNPFNGIGKPEPLKENLSGARIEDSPVVEDDDLRVRAASRRIDDTNRLVYAVDNNYLTIISCRFHY